MCSHGDHTPSLEQSDITLKSCCERDLEEQRRIEGYKETLLRDDPTQRRKQIAEEAVIRDIKRIPSPKDSDLSDDEDQVLEMLRRQRLEEMRKSVGTKNNNTLLQIEEDTLMATLKNDASLDETVCCLIQPSFVRKDDLLEYLMSIAEKHVRYRFITCLLQQHSNMPAILGQKKSSPDTVIVLLCQHVVVASITVLDDLKWREEHIEKSILSCIDSHMCIKATVKCNSSSDEEDEEPCSICGRRYPHQHV